MGQDKDAEGTSSLASTQPGSPAIDRQPLLETPQNWKSAWVLFVAASAAIATLVGSAMGRIFTLPDVGWYLKIAQGQSDTVLQPFVLRQLGPLVCRALASALPISIETAFLIEGAVSLLVLLTIVGFLLLRAGASPILLAAIAGLAFWAEMFNGLGLPDLWYAALLAIFLLFLYQKHFFAAALMLFPLYFSRESTILVLFCLLVAGWRRMRILDYGAALVAAYAGMRVVKMLSAGGLSNREQLSPMLYMAGKVPWNFAKNVLGLPLWNSLNQANCAVPQWTTTLHLGRTLTVGACTYQPAFQFWTLRMALSCFGLLPLLLIFLCIKKHRALWSDDVLLRFCLLYGALSFFLAPALGSSVPRLFAYSWPLFVVAAPILVIQFVSMPRRIVAPLLVLHLAISWSATFNHFNRMNFLPELVLLLAVGCAYIGSWMLLRQSKVASA